MQAVQGVGAGGGTVHEVLYTDGGHGNIVACAENGVPPGGGVDPARDHGKTCRGKGLAGYLRDFQSHNDFLRMSFTINIKCFWFGGMIQVFILTFLNKNFLRDLSLATVTRSLSLKKGN